MDELEGVRDVPNNILDSIIKNSWHGQGYPLYRLPSDKHCGDFKLVVKETENDKETCEAFMMALMLMRGDIKYFGIKKLALSKKGFGLSDAGLLNNLEFALEVVFGDVPNLEILICD